jgi:hypothetical protein
MARKLIPTIVLLAVSLAASAQTRTGTITGSVRNSEGVPQMGAAVKVLLGASEIVTVFTDGQGRYNAVNLPAGTYVVRASATAFLPSLRENVPLKAGAHLVVNLTLSTLFEAVQLLPKRRGSSEDEEDWKWTLRSASNRPILRMVDDAAVVVSEQGKSADDRVLKAKVAFLAGGGAEGFGSTSDMTTAFNVERSMFSTGTVSLRGNVGYGDANPSAVVRAGYRRDLGNSHPEVAFTMRRYAAPDAMLRGGAMQALALSVNDRTSIGGVLDLMYGGEFQSVQVVGHVNAYRPFGAADLHLGPNTVVEYRYATSAPNTRLEKGFDTSPADLSETAPRMSLAGGGPQIERARHQEVSVSRRLGKTNIQVAAYTDHIRNAALIGAGDPSDDLNTLADVYSGTFTYDGGRFDTNGMRVVVQRKLTGDLAATVDYAMGGVVDLGTSKATWQDVSGLLRAEHRHAVATKFSGTIPHAGTKVIASYRWTSGSGLTPVDMFNASAGQTDPFFSIFLRQPIPGTRMLPGKMEALVDIRNLLAQGYVPVVGQDGNTLYLVQSTRAVRGGLAFTF